MDTTWSRISRTVAAALSAALIGIVGMGAVSPETAQAAGVVVDHRAYGAPEVAVPREGEDA